MADSSMSGSGLSFLADSSTKAMEVLCLPVVMFFRSVLPSVQS